jgi:endonuclease/exonuclease/phosphatase family metal-dependent hydrolase
MITKVWSFLGDVRRTFSRSEWVIRLQGLHKYEDNSRPFGLVMVQVDGLAKAQFERALKNGHLPFLKNLLQKEKYALHPMYSGIPSNTPAVQAELFYGAKSAVPAFYFKDRASGKEIKMYDSAGADLVESRLRAQGLPLLSGGSSYCNIFTGGAAEPHFCASKTDARTLLRSIIKRMTHPFLTPLMLLLYIDVVVRTLFLIVVEFLLAACDCVRGTTSVKVFRKELEFIMARVMVCVLLRELIVIGACTDVARGLPIVHLNFVGYDEQSHRRGPASAFAHWSLQGIDDSIRRVWNAAKRSRQKDYDVWVYSDHGQERTESYFLKKGETLEKAVKRVFGDEIVDRPRDKESSGTAEWHVKSNPEADAGGAVQVTALGPIGHIYVPNPLGEGQKAEYAERLVREAGVPMVLLPGDGRTVKLWTADGAKELPRDGADVIGEEHPYYKETLADLIALCANENVGDLIAMGWKRGAAPMSFPIETGAHAGIGHHETSAFALLPHDAPLTPEMGPYLRPLELREAALRFLGKDPFPHFAKRARGSAHRTLRVMTYNVHGCVGMDGRLSTDRIARVIARHHPDVVALQELDLGRPRSLHVDQAGRIAEKLQMKHHFMSTFQIQDEQYGNAIFSRYPMTVVKMGPLPKLNDREGLEPRGALWVSIDVEGQSVQFINTHLSIWPAERLLQAKALAGPEWLKHPDCHGKVILCGDFNAPPTSPTYKSICSVLADCQRNLKDHRPHKAYPGQYPVTRIDHVFLSPGWKIRTIEVGKTDLDKVASDHIPLIVELDQDA